MRLRPRLHVRTPSKARVIRFLVAIGCAAACVPLVAGSAAATLPTAPVPGDLTGDGTTDPFTLTGPGLIGPGPVFGPCTVTVTPGDTTGPYAHQVFSVTFPGDVSSTGCPDTVVEGVMRGGTAVEEAMTWFSGTSGVTVVLRAFQRSFDVLSYPSGAFGSLGVADFNGDGAADFYEYSDEAAGLSTWTGGRTGRLTPDATPSLFDYLLFAPTPMNGDPDARTELLLDGPIGLVNGTHDSATAVYAYRSRLSVITSEVNPAALFVGDVATPPTVADVNGDGWNDVDVVGEDRTGARSTFTAFQRPNHTFYLGVDEQLSAASITAGQPETVLAAVGQTAPGHQRTGSVTFTVDGAAQAPVALTGCSGKARLRLPALAVGVHVVVAAYSGDAHHVATTSPPIDVTVNPAAG
jgi:hypothetical protein